MDSNTLYIGSNFQDHNSAVFACYDREIFAISEERFTRFKHDHIWPIKSLRALKNRIDNSNIKINRIVFAVPFNDLKSVECVDLYEMEISMRTFLETKYIKDYHEKRFNQNNMSLWHSMVKNTAPSWAIMKPELLSNHITRYVKAIFGVSHVDVRYYDHHDCHAVASFLCSPFSQALLLTMDGQGDGIFTKAYLGKDKMVQPVGISRAIRVKLPSTIDFIPPYILKTGIFHDMSIGHAYSILTWIAGFMPVSDEGKLEALAAYGRKNDDLYKLLANICSVENFEIKIHPENYANLLYFKEKHDYMRNLKKEDLAATSQAFLEDVYLKLLSNLVTEFKPPHICLSGGVAANIILNMKILQQFKVPIYIHPPMSDEGSSIGSCFLAILSDSPDENLDFVKQNQVPYYGTEYSSESVRHSLERNATIFPIQYKYVGREWTSECARRICEGKIGAIFRGRAEFGPRALGNRSIVADLRYKENVDKLNRLVKNRPHFQPFCPSFLLEEKDVLFHESYDNKHMTCGFIMRKEYQEILPCAVHVDGTSRVQFVSEADNEEYYEFLCKVKEITGYGGCINTSFNKHGRTICESPDHAITDFIDGNLDFMILEGFLVESISE